MARDGQVDMPDAARTDRAGGGAFQARERRRFGRAQCLALCALFALGAWARLSHVTIPFYSLYGYRQYRSALLARQVYQAGKDDLPAWHEEVWEATIAGIPRLEPPIGPWIVGAIHRLLGTETFWVPRVLSSACWLLGGCSWRF